jgi:Ni/Fe-hydrogenase subunit HybB-like protein
MASDALKAPPWHGWVTADLFLNSLSTGTFALAALCDLLAPAGFRPIARIGYLAAFPLALADLLCLVIDLGDPMRFHHMLRVFKPRSPMSIGVWSTSAFALAAFAAWVLEIVEGSSPALLRPVAAVFGLLAALAAGSYKGVLLSTTAQPGWNDTRWLGAALSVSSGALGAAFLLGAAAISGAGAALSALRVVLGSLLVLELAAAGVTMREMHGALALRISRPRLALSSAISLGAGLALPLSLLLLSSSADAALAASALTIAGALAFRHQLVMIPRSDPRTSQPQDPSSERRLAAGRTEQPAD